MRKELNGEEREVPEEEKIPHHRQNVHHFADWKRLEGDVDREDVTARATHTPGSNSSSSGKNYKNNKNKKQNKLTNWTHVDFGSASDATLIHAMGPIVGSKGRRRQLVSLGDSG